MERNGEQIEEIVVKDGSDMVKAIISDKEVITKDDTKIDIVKKEAD